MPLPPVPEIHFTKQFFVRLFDRFWHYVMISIATFLLDIGIGYALLSWTDAPLMYAAPAGFFIAYCLNYFLNYTITYRGTKQKFIKGFAWFMVLVISGSIFVSFGSVYLVEGMAISYFLARIITNIFLATTNFLVGTFFIFRVV